MLDQKVHVGSPVGETFPQTIVLMVSGTSGRMLYNMGVGGFTSSNIIETSRDGRWTAGRTEAITQTSVGSYASAEAARQAATTACDVGEIEGLEIMNVNMDMMGLEGFLIEGENERRPFFGNSALFLVD